jgi:hypothetical protein
MRSLLSPGLYSTLAQVGKWQLVKFCHLIICFPFLVYLKCERTTRRSYVLRVWLDHLRACASQHNTCPVCRHQLPTVGIMICQLLTGALCCCLCVVCMCVSVLYVCGAAVAVCVYPCCCLCFLGQSPPRANAAALKQWQ